MEIFHIQFNSFFYSKIFLEARLNKSHFSASEFFFTLDLNLDVINFTLTEFPADSFQTTPRNLIILRIDLLLKLELIKLIN